MRRRALVFLFLYACIATGIQVCAIASPYEGLSAFAASHNGFPCATYIELTKSLPRPAIATLYGTFGESSNCIRKVLNEIKDRPHLLEVHLSNEACRRHKRCKGGELLPRLTVAAYEKGLKRGSRLVQKAVTRRVKQVARYINQVSHPLTLVVVSLGLEDNLSGQAAAKLAGLVRPHLPDWVLLVRNHVGETAEAPTVTDISEAHGSSASFSGTCGIQNLDGTSVYSVTDQGRGFVAGGRQRECLASFLWLGRLQGITKLQFVDPLKRKFYLTSGDVGLIKELLK